MRTVLPDILRFLASHQHYLLAGWLTYFAAKLITWVVANPARNGGWTPARVLEALAPRPLWQSRSSHFDVFMFLLERLIAPLLALGELALLTLIAKGIAETLGAVAHLHPVIQLNAWALVPVALVGFIVTDFSSYLAHYLMHFVPALWEIHKVHHSASTLSPFTTSRSHPFEQKFNLALNTTFTGLYFGLVFTFFSATIDQLIISIAFTHFLFDVFLLGSIRHSDLDIGFGRLERIFVSPRVHHLHHSVEQAHWNKNMGIVLSVWDHMFGTFHAVKKGQAFTFGIGEGAEVDAGFNGVYGGLLRPVARMFGVLIAGRPHSAPVGEMAVAAGADAVVLGDERSD